MKHRDEKLDSFLHQRVQITFIDGQIVEGILGYADAFSTLHQYKKVGYYYIDDICFRKSHIKKIKSISYN